MSVFSGPEIVNDGLVLHLDAANPKSYPGTGTTWYDLSKNNHDSTMLNSPVYGSENGGDITLDGVNDYIRIPSSTMWQMVGSNTINVFIKPISGSGLVLCYQKGGWIGYQMTLTSTVYCGVSGGNDSTPSWNYIPGWQLITWVIDRTLGKYIVYRNGVQLSMTTISHPALSTASNLYIGARGDVPDNFWNGKISLVSLYNRALSASEIQQNFNALRGRYGI